ncbi:uncharacterized protein LOC123498920 [Portunus trituberculatus]|uniref:uncharacterized protein LOC123498920 n=1 Tax=Portunus trituberculatus TaxID=210409 RepID=UPI001E1D1961|nr:uncharacterized protein LOC123498920 [Portunus trituberculatus]
MTVVAPAPRPNSLLPRAPAPWRPAAAAALGLPAAVQSLLQQLGGTFHTYHPFRRARNEGEPDNNIPRSPAPLLLLTRNTLVASFGLRKLRRLLLWAGAPRAVSRLVSTVAASECESLGAAPLTDVFAQPFFHRAVTWRVTCCLDRQPYLTTYAATSAIHGYCVPWGGWHWLGWSADAWFWVDHQHVMSVWGVVYDDVTGNAFYLLDTPIATLDQIQRRLTACGSSVPEELVWTVVYQVGAALLHMLRAGLPYTPLALDNVFLLRDRIALENMLSRKHRMTGCGCETWRGSSGHQRATASGSSERCFVHHVGQVIFALLTCHLRSQPEGNLPPCSPVNTLRSLKHLYSPSLLRLLSRTLAGGVSMAWGVMGGCGEGRVAVRAFQWETQWEQLDPCPEAEWPLSDSEAFFLKPSPESLPSEDPSSITVSHHQASVPLRDDAPPVSLQQQQQQQQQQEHEELWGYSPRGSEGNSPMPDFLRDSSPVQLAQVVMMAAERVVALRGGGSLAEAVRTSPHRLIQHVMTAQKKHLKTK